MQDSNKYAAQERYSKKNGLVSKSYKLSKEVVDEFKKACDTSGVSQAMALTELMTEYVRKSKRRD